MLFDIFTNSTIPLVIKGITYNELMKYIMNIHLSENFEEFQHGSLLHSVPLEPAVYRPISLIANEPPVEGSPLQQ